MNTGDKKETPLADLGIALRKMFPCLPLRVIGNVFYPKTSCFVPKTCAAFFFSQSIVYHTVSLGPEQNLYSDLKMQSKFYW